MKSVFSVEEIHSKFGKYIKAHREAMGLDQRTLAKKIGVSQSFICKIETGTRRVDLGDAIRFCNAVNGDLEDFVCEHIKEKGL